MTDELPVRHNIDGFTDTRVRRVFKWLADGVAVDLTGWTGRLRIGQSGLLVQEVGSAVTTGGVLGTVTLVIPANTITVPGLYWYVLDLIDPSANPVRFVNGNLRVSGVFP